MADANAFQHSAHLGDKSLHDDDGDNRKQHFVIANVVQLKNDEASVQQVQLLVGVEQEVIFTATVIGFQHIQESPYIKILLTGSLLFQDILILVTDKFIEGIEGGFYAAVPADFLQKEIDRFHRVRISVLTDSFFSISKIPSST